MPGVTMATLADVDTDAWNKCYLYWVKKSQCINVMTCSILLLFTDVYTDHSWSNNNKNHHSHHGSRAEPGVQNHIFVTTGTSTEMYMECDAWPCSARPAFILLSAENGCICWYQIMLLNHRGTWRCVTCLLLLLDFDLTMIQTYNRLIKSLTSWPLF